MFCSTDEISNYGTRSDSCEPSSENALSRMPDRLHGTHCHLTLVLQHIDFYLVHPYGHCNAHRPNGLTEIHDDDDDDDEITSTALK